MEKSLQREEIFKTVRACVADSLALNEEELTCDARLIDDLGADSLDFLDIIFGLEKRFSIKLRDPTVELLARAEFSQSRLNEGGYLSSEALDKLAQWIPAINTLENRDQVSPQRLYSLITIDILVLLVEKKMSEKELASE
ncbi:MAG: acyl carrier protein [Acidobacteriota bacterium]